MPDTLARVSRSELSRPEPGQWTEARITRDAGTASWAAGAPDPGPPRPRTVGLRLAPGCLVPGTRYRIVRWLGEGGMGVVYEAEHEDIHRRVALKVMREDRRAVATAAAAFRDEARTASQIGSAYIVEIHDIGSLPDGRILVTMELADGTTLLKAIEDAPLPPERLIAILRQVCKGLHDAHEAGIVHRDIKPENILLTQRSGRPDAVKIVDFGVARMQQKPTVDKGPVGTPLYMAPEIIASEAHDRRVDVYSLGCTAYEMVVGQPPFFSREVDAVLASHLSDEPADPLTAVPGLEYPRALLDVIMRCLTKDPTHRYADMGDLEAALCEAQIASGIETLWDDLPVPQVEPERRARLLRDMPSPEAMVGAGRWRGVLVAVAVVLAIAVGSFWVTRPPGDEALAEVDALTHAARAAAGRAFWVYPDPADPDAPTAYRRVRELEDLGGGAEDEADDRAEMLREEFAATLVRLGDRYWDREAARVFAVDYYLQALLFSPEDERARERAAVSAGQLAELRRKAAIGEFTPVERIAVQPLVILASDDEDQAIADLAEHHRASRGVSLSHDAHIDSLLRDYDVMPLQRIDGPPEQGSIVEPAMAPEVAAAPAARTPLSRAHDAAPAQGAQPAAIERGPRTHRSRARAKELAKQARVAVRARRREEAEELFHRALAADQGYAPALMGLSDVLFDRSRYAEALRYAELAVASSPGNGAYRIRLGDTYFKVMRYSDAKEQYARAVELGNPKGSQRLQKVQRKLGTSGP